MLFYGGGFKISKCSMSKGLQVKRSTNLKVPKSKGLQVKRPQVRRATSQNVPSQKVYKILMLEIKANRKPVPL